jgi:hypothetical protein
MNRRWASSRLLSFSEYLVPAGLLAILGVVVTQLRLVQQIETNVAAVTLAFVMFPDAVAPPGTDIVVFGLTDGQTMGIRMTLQNSTALLSLPLLLATAAIVWLRPARGRGALLSLAAAVGVLAVENQLRFLTAAIISDSAPESLRIGIGAIVFGSTATVVCMASAVLTYVLVLVAKRSPKHAGAS